MNSIICQASDKQIIDFFYFFFNFCSPIYIYENYRCFAKSRRACSFLINVQNASKTSDRVFPSVVLDVTFSLLCSLCRVATCYHLTETKGIFWVWRICCLSQNGSENKMSIWGWGGGEHLSFLISIIHTIKM